MSMRIEVVFGDITTHNVDAIVNAANTSLLGGGGVDGAIHKQAGPDLLAECREIRARQGGCKVGEAVVTAGYRLPARQVIHTVGPTWMGGTNNEEALLASCYTNCLRLAEELGLESVAFPNVSTGVYRFPKDRAAAIAIETVRNFPAESINNVLFVCFDRENYQLYTQALS